MPQPGCQARPQARESQRAALPSALPCTALAADDNFAKLVMGKLGPQQAFLMRKLKIQGSMG